MNNIQSHVTTYVMKMLQPAQTSETVTNRNNSVEDFQLIVEYSVLFIKNRICLTPLCTFSNIAHPKYY